MEKYSLPIIKIIDVQKKAESIRTEIEIVKRKEYFNDPIAPAWISKGKDSNVFTFDFHKLISFKGKKLVFETYTLDTKLPIKNEEYTFCSTFMWRQIELIKDTSKKWVKKKFDKNLCSCDLALWGDIDEEGSYGYTDGEHWITIDSYEEYIKNDILQIRKS